MACRLGLNPPWACHFSRSSPLLPVEDCAEIPKRRSKTIMFDAYRDGLTTPELPKITRLVPFERYLSAIRWQFVRGVLVGIVASGVFAIPLFRYANIRQHGASLQQVPGQTALGNSDSQDAPRPRRSTSEVTGTSFAPAVSPKPLASNSPSYSSDTSAELARAKGRVKSPALNPVSQPAPSTAPSSSDLKPTKKTLATLAQLWASVEAGDSKAAVALADLYLRGDTVPVNCEQARVLLFVASRENNAEATKKLQDLDENSNCPLP